MTDKKTKLHLWTIDDLRKHGHYMIQLALAEKPEVVTVRMMWNDEDTHSLGGKEVHVIRPAGLIPMVKLPDGGYIEIYPHELEAIKERHTLVWENDDTGALAKACPEFLEKEREK